MSFANIQHTGFQGYSTERLKTFFFFKLFGMTTLGTAHLSKELISLQFFFILPKINVSYTQS